MATREDRAHSYLHALEGATNGRATYLIGMPKRGGDHDHGSRGEKRRQGPDVVGKLTECAKPKSGLSKGWE